MPGSVALGNLVSVVERLVASGRYNSKSEVIREGIRPVEEREKKLAARGGAFDPRSMPWFYGNRPAPYL